MDTSQIIEGVSLDPRMVITIITPPLDMVDIVNAGYKQLLKIMGMFSEFDPSNQKE